MQITAPHLEMQIIVKMERNTENNSDDASFNSEDPIERSNKHHTRESIRSKLWEGIDKTIEDALIEYLFHHDVGEEDPMLILEHLPHLETLQGNVVNGGNKALVQAALAPWAQDIGQLGSLFLFTSHDNLQKTKQRLQNVNFHGNVNWAFYYGQLFCNKLFADFGFVVPPASRIPTINTRLITFYSHATGKLTHDQCDFFML